MQAPAHTERCSRALTRSGCKTERLHNGAVLYNGAVLHNAGRVCWRCNVRTLRF